MVNGFWVLLLWFLILSATPRSSAVRTVGNPGTPISLPLTNLNNRNYFGEITIGPSDHGQTLKVDFDTGSTDLIIVEAVDNLRCSDPVGCAFFKPEESSAVKEIGETFEARFIDGTLYTGKTAIYTVTVGRESQIEADILLGLAKVTGDFYHGIEGTFGLGFLANSQFQTKIVTPFNSLIGESDLPRRFSVYAKKEADIGRYENSGELYIGGYNKEYMASDNFLTTVSVAQINSQYNRWVFVVKSIGVGDKIINLKRKDGSPVTVLAMPDTASPLIDMPPIIYNSIINLILKDVEFRPPKGQWFNCHDLPDDLPKIELILDNGFQLEVGPEYYLDHKDHLFCISRIEPSDGLNYIVLGSPLFHRYYTMFDYEKKEMSFALAKQPAIREENLQPGKSAKEYFKTLTQEQFNSQKKRFLEDVKKMMV